MFNTERFLKEQFKTPPELRALFSAYSITPPRDGTVSQWFVRASVPSTWFPVLLAVLELHKGGPVSIVEYLED